MSESNSRLIQRVLAAAVIVCCLIGFLLCGGAPHVVLLRILLCVGILGGVGAMAVTFLGSQGEDWEEDEFQVNGRNVSVDSFRTVVDYVHENIKVMERFSGELEGNIGNIEREVANVGGAVESISSNASNQVNDTADLVDAMGSVDDVISRTTEQVEVLGKSTEQMGDQNRKLETILDELFKISVNMKSAIDEVHKQTDATNASVEEIRKVTDIISGIATQTNLLSLNASIEAARAGEAGKGFAVVADEVRALAEQSNESAAQIGEIVNTLIDNSNTSVNTMLSVLEEIDNQNKKLTETKDTFVALTGEMDSVSVVVDNIASVVDDLDSTKYLVMEKIQGLTTAASSNAETADEAVSSLSMIEKPMEECKKAPQVVRDIADELKRDTGKRF